MKIYPAVDLKDGQVVRLKQGDFNQETVFNPDPEGQAVRFERQGADWLHIVDLDGAREGKNRNSGVVEQIKDKTDLKLQLGGGIRSLAGMDEWINKGIERLIIGTLAVQEPLVVKEALSQFGRERIVISIDARNGSVATHGWLEDSGYNVIEFAREMVRMGVQYLLYTDISRDGMLTGPDLDTLKELVMIEGAEIIASGGVSDLGHLYLLKKLGVEGVIIGKALYQGYLNLPEIFRKIGNSS